MNKSAIRLFTFLIIVFSNLIFGQTISTDIKSLSKGADAILTGQVLTQKSDWNKDKTMIFTEVTIRVDEYLKGNNNPATIKVIHLGGEVGEVGELYTHVPSFSPNEEMLLFVKKNDQSGNYSVFQGEEGKITLYSDLVKGEKVTAQKVNVSVLKDEVRNSLSEK